MNIFKRIKAKTPKRNKRIGRIVTVIGGACLLIAESGQIDQKPTLKILFNVIGLLCGANALYHAQKVEDESL